MLWNKTRRVSEDAFAVLQGRRRRLPAVFEPALQEFIRARPMIPDGDRRHDAKSGQPEHEPAIAIGDQQFVTKLVLRDEVELRHRQVVRCIHARILSERREFQEIGVCWHARLPISLTGVTKLS